MPLSFTELRGKMVREQIRARGITDANVLNAMARVPRHQFVPKEEIRRAYEDTPLPIGKGQTISQPFIVALMTQSLALDKHKLVLEIGTGSGYQTAVLAELCREVYSIERIKDFLDSARSVLSKLNYQNIKTFLGDGNEGIRDMGQVFDAIIITAASRKRPERLFSQLAVNGRLLVPIGDRYHQRLTMFIKNNGHIEEQDVCECTFVPLIGEYGWPLN